MSILDIIADYLEENQTRKVFINSDINNKFNEGVTVRITGSNQRVFKNDIQELIIQFVYKSKSYITTEEISEEIDDLLLSAPVLSNDKYEIVGFINKTALFDQDVVNEFYYKSAIYRVFLYKK